VNVNAQVLRTGVRTLCQEEAVWKLKGCTLLLQDAQEAAAQWCCTECSTATAYAGLDLEAKLRLRADLKHDGAGLDANGSRGSGSVSAVQAGSCWLLGARVVATHGLHWEPPLLLAEHATC
jgi:hypothetical protein